MVSDGIRVTEGEKKGRSDAGSLFAGSVFKSSELTETQEDEL